MQEQITLYNDTSRLSPYCLKVELALVEAGASYTAHGFNVYSKPAWYAKVNSISGKIPTITYGGPAAPPEEPSPLSFKLTESCVILDFIADIFPGAHLLPPTSDPIARARARFFVDTVGRYVDGPPRDFIRGYVDGIDKVVEGLHKIQELLPDPEALGGGEYAIGGDFTIADCAVAPFLLLVSIMAKTDLGRFEPGLGKKLEVALAGEQFERLRRYKKALWERESVKKVLDPERYEATFRKVFARNCVPSWERHYE